MSQRACLHLPDDAPLFLSNRQAGTYGLTWNRLNGPAAHRRMRGVYRTQPRSLLPLDPQADRAEHRALVAALQWDAEAERDIASHWSAAYLWGFPDVGPPPQVHLTSVAGDRRRRVPGTQGHRGKILPSEVVKVDGVLVTSPERTWLDLAALVGEQRLVVWGDWLCHPVWGGHWDAEPLVTPASLGRVIDEHRGRPGVRLARQAQARVRVGSNSSRETGLRLALVDAGLPEPRLNMPILDRQGEHVHEGDLVYEEYRITLEYEGRHHSETLQVERDIARHERLEANDWLELRFSARHAYDGWRTAVEKVRRGLLSRGWTP